MSLYREKINYNFERNQYMYYPKQIPYLLDKEFKENIEYVEYNRFKKYK